MNPNTGIAEEIRNTNCLLCGCNINIDIALNNTGRPDCCDFCAIDRHEEYLVKSSLKAAESQLQKLREELEQVKAINERNEERATEYMSKYAQLESHHQHWCKESDAQIESYKLELAEKDKVYRPLLKIAREVNEMSVYKKFVLAEAIANVDSILSRYNNTQESGK